MPAHAPITVERFSGGNIGSTSPSEFGVSAAAPTPWSTRAATSASTDGASAHSAEPSVNRASPIDEQPPAPVQVAEPPGRDERGGEHDRVGGQHPRQPGEADAGEVAPQVRERDVDDEEVEDREEDGEADDGEDATGAGRLRGDCSGCFMQPDPSGLVA